MSLDPTSDTTKQLRMLLFKGMENKWVLKTSEIYKIEATFMSWDPTSDTTKQIRKLLFKGMENKWVLPTSEIYKI